MTVILILIGVLIGLFVAAFLSKRHFGVLALGLAAGAIISPIWGETAGFVVSSTGILQEGPIINAIAFSVLILVPAILFMFHGYAYKHIVARVIGAVMFTLLAAAFLVEPVGSAVTLTGPVGNIYNWFASNHDLIISIGVALGVADFLFAKSTHKSEKKRH